MSDANSATSRTLGAIVVGTGWGCLTHVPALRAVGVEVKHLVGTDRERTRARARALDIANATVDLERALDDSSVDIVVVATPPSTHADIVVKAARSGKHVLCEKPFAHSLDDAARMRDAVDQAGVIGLVGHEFRWLPNSITTMDAVRSGLIGEPRMFTHVRMSSALAAPGASAPAWFERHDCFGGWLNAEIQHLVDEARSLLGDFATVTALEGQTTEHDWDAGESFAVQFTTVAGAMGSILSSAGSIGPSLSVQRLSGTKGSLWTNGDGEISLDDGAGPRTIGSPTPTGAVAPGSRGKEAGITELVACNTLSMALSGASARLVEPTTRLYEAFVGRIRGTPADGAAPALPTFADGYANTAIHMAILASVAAGSTETLNYVPAAC